MKNIWKFVNDQRDIIATEVAELEDSLESMYKAQLTYMKMVSMVAAYRRDMKVRDEDGPMNIVHIREYVKENFERSYLEIWDKEIELYKSYYLKQEPDAVYKVGDTILIIADEEELQDYWVDARIRPGAHYKISDVEQWEVQLNGITWVKKTMIEPVETDYKVEEWME